MAITDYQRAYYQKNKEKLLQRHKEWRQKVGYNKKYYENNIEKCLESCKKYRDKNREIIRQKAKTYYLNGKRINKEIEPETINKINYVKELIKNYKDNYENRY